MTSRQSKCPAPRYPRAAKPRPVLAGVGAAMLGVAALTGCGGMGPFEARDDLNFAQPATSMIREDSGAPDAATTVVDAGPHPVADAGADAGPNWDDFFAGGMPAPDYDGGW